MEKSYELKPTNENILYAYENNDIGRNEKINSFIDILNSINDNCSIAINGEWGSGKTFFVKQVEHIINSINGVCISEIDKKFKEEYLKSNKTPSVKQRAIYYDAWKHDDEEDPIYSLIFAIINDTDVDYDTEGGKKLINLLSKAADLVTNKNISSLLSEIENPDDMKKVQERILLKENFTELLHDTIAENYGRLVLIIDELDRCCPSFAVKMLERLKHYFDDELITYVFSTNLPELNCTIRTFYGDDFDATAYLNRFFDFVIEIPEIDVDKYVSSIDKHTNRIYSINNYKIELAKKYKLTMREMAKYFRMINIAVNTKVIEKTNNLMSYRDEILIFFDIYIVPVIVILRIVDIKQYHKFINGEDGTPLVEAMINIDNEWALKKLINGDETFDTKNSTNNKVVDKKDRIMKLYNAIFKDKDSNTYQEYVGSMPIYYDAKQYVMNIANMLSDMASL